MTGLVPELDSTPLDQTDIMPSGSDFIREYFRGTKGKVFICAIRNPKSKLRRGEVDHIITRSRAKVDQFIAEHDRPENESAIYFATATLREGATSRTAANCWQLPSVFADVDDHGHDLTRTQVVNWLETLQCPPTFIIDSGHGLQPHWLLIEPSEDAERVIELRKKLQSALASDAVHDAPRLMRLPGSHNSKRGDWLPVEVVSYSNRRYTLDELEQWTERATEIIPRKNKKTSESKPKTNGAAARTTKQYAGRDDDDERIADALPYIDATDRDVWLTVGMALKSHLGERGRTLWDNWSASCPEKFDDRDQEKTWRSFKRDGIGIATLFHHAQQTGWQAKRAKRTNSAGKAEQPKPEAEQKISSNRSRSGTLKSAPASSFELSAIDWLWPKRFALGKLGLIVGLPDEGKGQILADMAARVTGGLEWPCQEGIAPQGNVILLTAEDDPKDTVVPRLLAAGADLNRVEIVTMVKSGDRERMFNLISDLDLLRQKIIEIGNVKMIQIDPISAYLGVGKIDSFRTTDVRAVLGPVVDLAGNLMASIIGILHFNKKLDVTNALLRISDSLAFGATARHVYAVINDAENKRKLFVRAKNNLAPDTKALAYSFGTREVGHDRKTGKLIAAPHILWHPHHVDVTATEAMQAANEIKSPTARDDAKKFLRNILAAGPMPKTEIEEAADANCISDATLRRAKTDLEIIAKKNGLTGGWMWELPKSAAHWTD